MANRWFTQFFGTLHKKPVLVDCNFIVDPANVNGTGLRSFKGAGVASVFLHSTASFVGTTHTTNVIDAIASTANLVVGMPVQGTNLAAGTVISAITSATAITINPAATGSGVGDVITYQAVGSPNPALGYIQVNFQDNYNYYYFGTSNFASPLSGVAISISGAAVLTVGNAYVITSVGTSTQANWHAVGLPLGIIPAVGESFIASVTGLGTGTGQVQVPSSSGIAAIEIVGDPNQTMGSNFNGASKLGGSSGAYILLQARSFANLIAAPATGSQLDLSFFLSNSSILVNGD